VRCSLLDDVYVAANVRNPLREAIDMVDGVMYIARPAHIGDEVTDRQVIGQHGSIRVGHEIEMPRSPHGAAVRCSVRCVRHLRTLGDLLPGVEHQNERRAGDEDAEQSERCDLTGCASPRAPTQLTRQSPRATLACDEGRCTRLYGRARALSGRRETRTRHQPLLATPTVSSTRWSAGCNSTGRPPAPLGLAPFAPRPVRR